MPESLCANKCGRMCVHEEDDSFPCCEECERILNQYELLEDMVNGRLRVPEKGPAADD